MNPYFLYKIFTFFILILFFFIFLFIRIFWLIILTIVFLIRIFSFCFLLCLDQLQLVGNLQRLIGQLSNFSKLLVGFIRPLVHCKKMRGLITEFLASNWHSKYFVTQAIAYVYKDFSLSFDYKINLLVITLGNSQDK